MLLIFGQNLVILTIFSFCPKFILKNEVGYNNFCIFAF